MYFPSRGVPPMILVEHAGTGSPCLAHSPRNEAQYTIIQKAEVSSSRLSTRVTLTDYVYILSAFRVIIWAH